MSLKPLQAWPGTIPADAAGIQTVLQQMSRIRLNDQTLWNGLSSAFIGGRKVAKVPSSSGDTSGSAVGDFNVSASYAYFCVASSSGVTEWVRAAVGTF